MRVRVTRRLCVAVLAAAMSLPCGPRRPSRRRRRGRAGCRSISRCRSIPRCAPGSCANGLRYYIRRNGRPANRVSLRLAVNVGSIHEEDDQRGLAHFLEHMAFNGTREFQAR